MSVTDEIQRLKDQVRELQREVDRLRAATGKLDTRPIRGGGSGDGWLYPA